jgi:transcriptional regulator with XRE-family HTH domain
MDLGHRVRDLRNARHLSQVELASRAGVARNTLNRIENGHLMPTAPVIEHLAEALGVAPGALFEEPVPLDKAPGEGPHLEGTMITFPEGAVDEVVKLHKQGKLSKADVREAIGKLTDLALENATEEIEEYMAEMAARVKEAHGDRPK